MKKLLKIIIYILLALILLILLTAVFFRIKWGMESARNMKLAGEPTPTLTINGLTFRDLNKNGKMDTYENVSAPSEDRVTDLINQMNLEEKAGMLFAHFLGMNDDGSLMEIPTFSDPFSFIAENTSTTILKKKMTQVQNLGGSSARNFATWNNNLQKLAERTRLGIPITLLSDPRHGAVSMAGASAENQWISTWPSQLGLAATRDTALVRQFGDIARQEYLKIGIRLAQHPMADLGTEPRWARINGTFGEDADLSAQLTKAYVLGFQGDTLSHTSVACQVKHFPGGGPQEDGWDAHFPSGKNQVYPGNKFDYHLKPFVEGSIAAHAAQYMPYYGVPINQGVEEVGFNFSKEIIQNLLRDSLGFEGVVATDWGIIADSFVKDASAWGVEDLSEKERIKKVLDAGVDLFGGEYGTEWVIELVNEGKISEDRLNLSVRRILRDKFTLGLFDDPFVDLDETNMVRNPAFVDIGKSAQRKSLVLLKNEGNMLPLAYDAKIYLVGFSSNKLSDNFAQIVTNIDDADVIIQKIKTPSSPPKGESFLERMIPQGRLEFTAEEKSVMLERMKLKPTVSVITITRPPVIPDINEASRAVIADFECEEDILLELVFGEFIPSGKLPIEIPSSTEAVEKQLEDVPYDSKDPLYPFGHGLSF